MKKAEFKALLIERKAADEKMAGLLAEVKALLAERKSADEKMSGQMAEGMTEENQVKCFEHLRWVKEECKNRTNPGRFIKDGMLVAVDMLYDLTEVLETAEVVAGSVEDVVGPFLKLREEQKSFIEDIKESEAYEALCKVFENENMIYEPPS